MKIVVSRIPQVGGRWVADQVVATPMDVVYQGVVRADHGVVRKKSKPRMPKK